MATFTTKQTVGIPQVADTITPVSVDTPGDAATTATSTWVNEDNNGWAIGATAAGSATMRTQDATVVVPELNASENAFSTGTITIDRTDHLLDALRTNFHLCHNATTFYRGELVGRWDFNDCSLVWRNGGSIGGARINWPGAAPPPSNDPAQALLLFNTDGFRARGISEGTGSPNRWDFQMSQVHPDSSIAGLELDGFVSAFVNSFTAFHRFSPSQSLNSGSIGTSYQNTYGFSWRTVHQGGALTAANTQDNDTFTPPQYGLFTRPLIHRLLDTSNIPNAYKSVNAATVNAKQFNHAVAEFWVNPDWGTFTDEDLHIAFHQTNQPDNANPTVLWLFQAHNPLFRDAAALSRVTEDIKIRYANASRMIPTAYTYNSPPAVLNNNEVVVSGTDGSFSGVQHGATGTALTSSSGMWVQADRRYFNLQSTTHYPGTTSDNARRNPGNANNTIEEPGSQTFWVKSFSHNFEYEFANALSSSTCEDTALLEHNQVIYDARSLAPYLNSRTATTALTQDIDDFADIYPSLRRYWYDTFSLQQAFGVSVSGTTLTFDRNTEFTTTGNLATTTTNNVINLMDTTPTLTGDNTTFAFGTTTVDWNSITPPSGIILSGGTHNELPAPSMLNLTVTNNVTLNVAGGTDTPVTFDSLFGDITIGSGTLTVNNTSGSNVNVQINEDDVPTGFVFGTNFTRVDVPLGAQTRHFEIPSTLRNGFWAVRNVTQDVELVAPSAVSDSNFRYTVSTTTPTTQYNPANDMIRIYWRPTVTANDAYNTTIFEFSGNVMDGTVTLVANRIASVLWESTINTEIGAATCEITDGDFNHNSVDRFALKYENTSSILSEASTASGRTLYLTMLATNDINYLERMIDNERVTQGEVPADIIYPGSGEVLVNPDFAYITSNDLASQQEITALSSNAGISGSSAVLRPEQLSSGQALSIIVFPNPAGATPAQIAAAAASGTGIGVDGSETGNRIAYLVSNGSSTDPQATDSSFVGIVPKEGDYDADVDYAENL